MRRPGGVMGLAESFSFGKKYAGTGLACMCIYIYIYKYIIYYIYM